MTQRAFGKLTLPIVVGLIVSLAYGSQVFFLYIEPSPLNQRQTLAFNIMVGCIWVTYLKACFTSPGWVPSGWGLDQEDSNDGEAVQKKQRWCRKCEAFKPPRAHHCKACARCIPKMDHHCPWTVNCVSHRTFPHFLRFLIYAVTSMSYLEYFIYVRGAVIWKGRNLPSYLGPSAGEMVVLFLFFIVNSITLFAIGILLARNVWCLGANTTTIEDWEVERHETLVRRAKKLGGYLDGPNGTKVRIIKQEFPYDIGILQNMRQGWGANPLLWLWPFAPTPSNNSGLSFDTNDFEDSSTTWPPPDPDRMPRQRNRDLQIPAFIHGEVGLSKQDQIDHFRQRQLRDLEQSGPGGVMRQQRFRERYGDSGSRGTTTYNTSYGGGRDNSSGEEAWRDSEGDRLDDFGVDEDVEFYDEETIPLAKLLRRRRSQSEHRDIT